MATSAAARQRQSLATDVGATVGGSLVRCRSSWVRPCIRPSRRRMIRLAWSAMSSSCVTMMIVLPSSLSRSSISMISSLVTESRLPVGFVGQDEVRVVHQAAGDRHALLLTAGKLRRPVVEPVAQADHVGQLAAAAAAPRRVSRPW